MSDRCKVCFERLSSDSVEGFCGFHAKALTGEEIRMHNEWEALEHAINQDNLK